MRRITAGALFGILFACALPEAVAKETFDLAPLAPLPYAATMVDMPSETVVMSTPKLDVFSVKTKSFADKASDLIFRAFDLTGIKYKYGGTTVESGLDCSGFVGLAFRESLGAKLPRTAAELSKIGAKIKKNDLKLGDLVFYNTMRNRFSHVGIYVGDDKFIHSPSTGGRVRVDSMASSYWKKRFTGGRRVIDAL